MSKKEKLLKQLKEYGLFQQSGSGTISLTDIISPSYTIQTINTQPSQLITSINNLMSNLSYAITTANSQKSLVGNVQSAMGGQTGMSFFSSYSDETSGRTTYLAPDSVTTTDGGSFGIKLYIADQIAAGIQTVQAVTPDLTNYYTKEDIDTKLSDDSFKEQLLRVLGSMAPDKNYNPTDRLLTLSDLAGDSAGSFNNNDVRDAIETSPLAQFKHLPDISALNLGVKSGGESKKKALKNRRSQSLKH